MKGFRLWGCVVGVFNLRVSGIKTARVWGLEFGELRFWLEVRIESTHGQKQLGDRALGRGHCGSHFRRAYPSEST